MATNFKNGVLSAPLLTVAPCGLLSVAQVEEGTPESNWLRGYSVETHAAPTVRIISYNNAVVSDGDLYDGAAEESTFPARPFFLEIEAKTTGLMLVDHDPLKDGTVADQIKAASQKAVEYELWEGAAAKANPADDTNYLTKTGGADIVTTGGVSSSRALELIEQSIASSPTGARGIIHMTRDVASSLGSRLLYSADSRDDKQAYAVTRLGTLVVIGSGYTGAGPDGDAGAAASATNKWMYATGGVVVLLGDVSVDNAAFTSSANDHILLANRAASVHFDPSIWSAAQVTLS
jgi:hypothetical protein